MMDFIFVSPTNNVPSPNELMIISKDTTNRPEHVRVLIVTSVAR